MKFTSQFLQAAVTVHHDQLRQYAQRLVSEGIVKHVYLIGSTAARGTGQDIDLLYDFGDVGLAGDEATATEQLEQLVESTSIDSDSYDSFYKVDGRFFHLSSGAGRCIIENTDYGLEQKGKPPVNLA
jgi:predicted nucleotidyltransferase